MMTSLNGKTLIHRVEIREYERGWGMKVEDIRSYSTKELAEKYCAEFNSKNTSKTVPDWYMVAVYTGIYYQDSIIITE